MYSIFTITVVSMSLMFQVIYRALSPWQSVDPYGAAARDQLMITNLRVRLLQQQPCPCQDKDLGAASLPTAHYAIYDFIVKGSCLCHGHADHCLPATDHQSSPDKTSNVVRISQFWCVRNPFSAAWVWDRCCVLLTVSVRLPNFCCGEMGRGRFWEFWESFFPPLLTGCSALRSFLLLYPRGCSEDLTLGHGFTYHYGDLEMWKAQLWSWV